MTPYRTPSGPFCCSHENQDDGRNNGRALLIPHAAQSSYLLVTAALSVVGMACYAHFQVRAKTWELIQRAQPSGDYGLEAGCQLLRCCVKMLPYRAAQQKLPSAVAQHTWSVAVQKGFICGSILGAPLLGQAPDSL